MPQSFAAKLDFVIRALALTRGGLAARLGVDKSAARRWISGAVTPSEYNLKKLTALVADRIEGFTVLDWERDLKGLAGLIGVDAPGETDVAPSQFGDGLPLPVLEQSRLTTLMRGAAYEGIYRSTRPYAQRPGQFIHDIAMIRADANGLLRLRISTAGVSVDGWVLLLQNQLFCIAAELTSGGMGFSIFNGVNTVQAGVLDGLVLNCALDPGRTPTASAAIYERVGDLSDDPDADDRLFAVLAAEDPVSKAGSVPEPIRNHLTRDIGPAQLALGGDLLLRVPMTRSMSRGLSPLT